VDDETFEDVLSDLFGTMKFEYFHPETNNPKTPLFEALQAEALTIDALMLRENLGGPEGEEKLSWLLVELAKLEHGGFIERYPNGAYGAIVM
jgi:hypothetical protein